MRGVYLIERSPFYWLRYYDKYEPNPARKRKSVNLKIEVTEADRKRHKQGLRLIGTSQLREQVTVIRSALAQRNIEIFSGVRIIGGKTLSETLREYLLENPSLSTSSVAMYVYAVDKFISVCCEYPIYKYSKKDYSDFILSYKDKNKTTLSTITKHLSVIFNFALKKKYIKESIIKITAAPKGIPQPIPISDLITILAFYDKKETHLKERKINFAPLEIREQRLIVYLLFYTGLRKSSIFALYKKDIDFENEFIIASNIKGKKKFLFPLHGLLKTLLKDCNEKIISRTDKRLYFWDRDLKKMVKEGKIKKKYQIHSLRDTFSTLLASKRVDVSTIQDLLDHSNINITKEHYLLTDSRQTKKMLDKTFADLQKVLNKGVKQ